MAYDHANTEQFRAQYMPKTEDVEKQVEKNMSMANRVELYKKRTSTKEDW